MGWMTGVSFPAGVGIFLLATASRPALGSAHPPVQLVRGVPRVKQAVWAWSWPHISI